MTTTHARGQDLRHIENDNAEQCVNIFRGDAFAALATLPEDCVHAVVTDPPYGLASSVDAQEQLESWLSGQERNITGTGYAGAAWDAATPGPDLWRSVKRTVIPGGFVLAFAGSRTMHWTAMALQLAGFEIRDTWQWFYADSRQASSDLGKQAARCGLSAVEQQLLAGRRATMKPAYEPIIVARKPLSEATLTINELEHGVGALDLSAFGDGTATHNVFHVHDLGCIRGACLPGCAVSTYAAAPAAANIYPSQVLANDGLAVPKPRAAEIPRDEAGNTHLTVKPLALMRVLIRAVTRPGQVVLEPFAGSGTTVEAAMVEGRCCLAAEAQPDYWPLIEQRIDRARRSTRVA